MVQVCIKSSINWDLLVQIIYNRSDIFAREGDNYARVQIDVIDAILGGTVEIRNPDGKIYEVQVLQVHNTIQKLEWHKKDLQICKMVESAIY